jgi:LmbE family N-acetylglucosaminyl deacetylase
MVDCGPLARPPWWPVCLPLPSCDVIFRPADPAPKTRSGVRPLECYADGGERLDGRLGLSARQAVRVCWVKRNRPIAPVPYIHTEAGLPIRQKALVFLPHSDDGRYIGGSLALMNRATDQGPRNDMRIIVVASGYRSVEGDLSREEKTQVRTREALRWAELLGYRAEQVLFFGAEETYEARRGILPPDQERMNGLVAAEAPTMVFVPHLSDTAQHINHYARTMVMRAVTRWLASEYAQGRSDRDVLILEYPTNHVPILPPSDKNFIVAFTDPGLADLKHDANKAHKSQDAKGFDVMGKLIEAIDALRESDDVFQVSRAGRRFSQLLSDVRPNPRRSRGEHFGATRLRIRWRRDGTPVLVEERLKFPLVGEDVQRWHRP